ncbi:Nucleotide-binding, alpha-beta plait domain containing protein [Dorcoceras hygrometricum]|uniref:Nucleotide-binding, alpha-beta plait domain containing protein n=1 Tax=Dorcoceras hygrometricum TaxID=472368 RepID=A0A2Z7A8F2_9LAMI|nr:Nucleotide-binding, alpha-beta plait domain containing protein [Dorcoceras hygrometricum]
MRSVVASHEPESNPRATRAWLQPELQERRLFTVGGGRLRQSGPRPEGRLLRQPALEGLTRSARTDSPRQVDRNKFRRSKAVAAAAFEEKGGGSRTPQNPPQVLNTLNLVSVRESRIQYLCDPQWFRDTATLSRPPTPLPHIAAALRRPVPPPCAATYVIGLVSITMMRSFRPCQNPSDLLVQIDGGILIPVVDLIMRIYRRLQFKIQFPCDSGWSQAPRR